MSFKEILEKKKTEWEEMGKGYRWTIILLILATPPLMYVRGKQHDEIMARQEAKKTAIREAAQQRAATNVAGAGQANVDKPFEMRVLPQNNRNQGLEDLQSKLDMTAAKTEKAVGSVEEMRSQLKQIVERLSNAETRTVAPSRFTPPVDGVKPQDSLPGAGANTAPQTGSVANPGAAPAPTFSEPPEVAPKQVDLKTMKTWDSEPDTATKTTSEAKDTISIPIYSGIEAVMLTGINARSNAAGAGAVGSIVSANDVGAPFVSRVKGLAVGPNRYKISYLNDCFIGGSGVAVLSMERANVIAHKISCVDNKGVIFEGTIKAYGVDLDGIQGITGRVVTKQGSILAKAAAAGVASGLGSALTPTGISGYNSNQTSGQQGIQYPNPTLIAQQTIGSGVSSATHLLSKFYLDYAKEMFPVIEIDAGTRITWILKETLDLAPKTK